MALTHREKMKWESPPTVAAAAVQVVWIASATPLSVVFSAIAFQANLLNCGAPSSNRDGDCVTTAAARVPQLPKRHFFA